MEKAYIIKPENRERLLESIQTGLIDKTVMSQEEFRPALLTNNRQTKVINYLRKELDKCDEFYFSIAFITEGGLSLLLHTLEALHEKGIKGKLMTADYLGFNKPDIFRKLLTIPNLEIKISSNDSFHAKGYIFKLGNDYSVIIGSSNLTQGALTRNMEWNIRVTSTQNGELLQDTLNEFQNEWNHARPLDNDWIDQYTKIYESSQHYSIQQDIKLYRRLEPNKMQSEALHNLSELRLAQKDRALLISATGTGKTFLSVFDVAQVKPKRLLFIAHRERLLKSAVSSFRYVIGNELSMGFYTSTEKNTRADYIFASISTLNKDIHLQKFSPEAFDYIIIDEVHRAGAQTYQKILEYFKPKFLLGMTATPERTDNFNIFSIFHYNIAYEIRLQQALEENMLCPFHYFGITEIKVDGELLSDTSRFSYLICDERVDHIVKKASYYGYSGNRLKGLIFCSRNEEASILSEKLNQRGFKTIALSGMNTDEEREKAMERLEQDEEFGALEYIISVDIFNEGIDIPQVNQIIMLRKTQSSIVFIQQLGRGLRKADGKSFVTILDFIGNYNNNFLIPISLSGDQSFNKDNLRKFMNNVNNIIPGSSSVEFDAIIKEKIYKSINAAKFSEFSLLKAEYSKLKNKLGRIPRHVDFLEYEAIDLQNIILSKESYINFLSIVEKNKDFKEIKLYMDFINFVSKELSNGKRLGELVLLKLMIEETVVPIAYFKEQLQTSYDICISDDCLRSIVSILAGGFYRDTERKKYDDCTFLYEDQGNLVIAESFQHAVMNNMVKNIFIDLLDYSMMNYHSKYSKRYADSNFVLYEKYTRKDVCRLLNWHTNEVALNIGGYKYDEPTNTMCVYVTYEKDDDISDTIRYEDRFINRNFITCVSKNKRTLTSPEILRIYDYEKNGIQIHLFINRLKEEKEFYYLGKVQTYDRPSLVTRENGDTVVDIIYQLDEPVREDIYNFLIG